METFDVHVNAFVTAKSVEEARMLRQAVLRFLGDEVRGGVTVFSHAEGRFVPDVAPAEMPNRVRGVQEAQGVANSYIREVEKLGKSRGLDVAADYWNEFVNNATRTGQVDFGLLADLVAKWFGVERPEAEDVLKETAGVIAVNSMSRVFPPAKKTKK